MCRTADKTKERIGDAVDGKVLEPERDRHRAEGRAEGETRSSIKTLAGLVQDGIIDAKTAAKRMGVSVKKFKEMAAAQSFVL